jgi:hypothetical protein
MPDFDRAPVRSRWRPPSRVFAQGGALLAEPAPEPARRWPIWFPPSCCERALISHRHQNLQEQIFFKDTPPAMQLGIPFTAAL